MTGDMLFPIVFGDPRVDLNVLDAYAKPWGRLSGGSPPTSRSELAGGALVSASLANWPQSRSQSDRR
jgi:hypothetical protein